ncbi:MAG: hypothetical protein PHP10_03675 [Candidatus Omnitrophica bacterium]|nr:hypothetical protein [Candidatus Omnitrophota bacterium]
MNKKCLQCLEGVDWEKVRHIGLALAALASALAVVYLIKKIKEPPLEIPQPVILIQGQPKKSEDK